MSKPGKDVELAAGDQAPGSKAASKDAAAGGESKDVKDVKPEFVPSHGLTTAGACAGGGGARTSAALSLARRDPCAILNDDTHITTPLSSSSPSPSEARR